MSTPDDRRFSAIEGWLQETVIGLEMCPFARQPWRQGAVRILAVRGDDVPDWLPQLLEECELLLEDDPAATTTLALLPEHASLDDVLDVVAMGEELLAQLGFDGHLQLVAFHPDFAFEDSDPDDPANGVNRSPHPLVHLLRAADVEAAAASIDVDALTARNAALLRDRAAAGEG